MKNHSLIALFGAMAVFIIGCDNAKSVEYYLSHPEETRKLQPKCQEERNAGKVHEQGSKCANVLEAYFIVGSSDDENPYAKSDGSAFKNMFNDTPKDNQATK